VKRHTVRGEAHLEKGRTSKEKGRTSKEEQAHKSKQEGSQEGGVLIPRRVRTSRRIFTIKLEIYCCCKPLRGGRTSFVKRHTHGPWRRVLELRGEVHLEKGPTGKEKGHTSKEEQAHKSKQEGSQEGGHVLQGESSMSSLRSVVVVNQVPLVHFFAITFL
jgi:hypothetical protein